jgi:hypothetical protein
MFSLKKTMYQHKMSGYTCDFFFIFFRFWKLLWRMGSYASMSQSKFPRILMLIYLYRQLAPTKNTENRFRNLHWIFLSPNLCGEDRSSLWSCSSCSKCNYTKELLVPVGPDRIHFLLNRITHKISFDLPSVGQRSNPTTPRVTPSRGRCVNWRAVREDARRFGSRVSLPGLPSDMARGLSQWGFLSTVS